MNETPTLLTLEPTTPRGPCRRGRKILPPAFTITARIAMLVREPGTELPPTVRTPQDVHRIFCDMTDFAQESFQIATINKKNRLIQRHMITLGVLDASLIHQREVFRAAILDSCSALVLVHNHPSGDPAPSAEDLAITRQMVASGRIIGIRVLDHIIIGRPTEGRPGFFSIREAGLIDFELN